MLRLPVADRRQFLINRLIGTQPAEAWAIIRAMQETCHLPGDVCEFGVAQGATSALMASELLEQPGALHLFDSFQGLPAPTAKDELLHDIFGLKTMGAYAGTMACGVDQVLARLAIVGFPPERVVVHAGFLAETLVEHYPLMVRFAYVDVDLYESTRLALDFLLCHVVDGGIALVDDYGFFSSGAKTAVDEAAARGGWELRLSDPESLHFCTLTRKR